MTLSVDLINISKQNYIARLVTGSFMRGTQQDQTVSLKPPTLSNIGIPASPPHHLILSRIREPLEIFRIREGRRRLFSNNAH